MLKSPLSPLNNPSGYVVGDVTCIGLTQEMITEAIPDGSGELCKACPLNN